MSLKYLYRIFNTVVEIKKTVFLGNIFKASGAKREKNNQVLLKQGSLGSEIKGTPNSYNCNYTGSRASEGKKLETDYRTLNLITVPTRTQQIGEDKRDKVKEKTHPKRKLGALI